MREKLTKTCLPVVCAVAKGHRQALRIMKISVVLMIACLQVSAASLAQTVSLSEKKATLKQIFKEINRQTGYEFLYASNTLSRANPVDIDVSNASLEEVLAICFKDQPLTFTISDKTIVVKELPQEKPTTTVSPNSNLAEVSGRVTNAAGEPIIGVNILIKGTSQGTVSDADGRYSLQVPENAILIFTFIGYQRMEISVGSRTTVDVQLQEDVKALDEVVIAYGKTSAEATTSNIFTIKSDAIQKQPVTNPLLALQGRVPGLVITQASGFSGSGVKVRIQGENSIGGGNDPLYVIDGVQYPAQLLPTISSVMGSSGGRLASNNFATYGNPLSYINPADIESITVLKDADATAIYGSRAANGAILITTKRGKAGEQKVEFNFKQGWGQVARKMDLLNLRQYLDMRYEALDNDNIPLSSLTPDGNYDLTVWDTTRSTDWQDVLIGNTSQYTDLQASISGGNDNTNFSIGAGYHRETTVLPVDFSDQKGSLHFQINSTSKNKRFRLSMTGNYMVDVNKLPHTLTTDITEMALQLAPNAPALYNSDGSINWAPNPAGNTTWDYPGNPVAQLLNTYRNTTTNMVNNLELSYNILPGLVIKSSMGYTNLHSDELVRVPLTSTAPEQRANTTRIGIYGNNTITSWIIEPQVSYGVTIARGELETLLGATLQDNTSQGQSILGFGYPSDDAIENMGSAARTVPNPGIDNVYRYNAFFGRINYSWERKYILNVNFRRDGSSRFGSNNRFHNFGSVGGAWIFSKEQFVIDHAPFLSFGKIRTSYGVTGSDQIGDYQYLSLYTTTAGVPYQGINPLRVNNLSNPYLQWEETRKFYVGLDLGFLKDRITTSIGHYINRSSNQLLGYQLPVTTGFNSVLTNFPALVQNSGWEVSITTVNVESGNFTWTTGINLTLPKNELIDFPGLETSSYASSLEVGQPITVTRKLHMIGVDPASGRYYFSSATNPFNPQFQEDANVYINTQPTAFGGFQNTIRFKGLELDFLFQYVKQKGPNYFYGFFPGLTRKNQPAWVLDRWQQEGDNATHQMFDSNLSLGGQWTNAARFSDAGFSDASFIRLKNVSLSWQLPDAVLKKMNVSLLKVYVQAQNLLTITKYKGLDPETLSSSSLPPLKVLTIGLQASF